jgi:hypothetical protein
LSSSLPRPQRVLRTRPLTIGTSILPVSPPCRPQIGPTVWRICVALYKLRTASGTRTKAAWTWIPSGRSADPGIVGWSCGAADAAGRHRNYHPPRNRLSSPSRPPPHRKTPLNERGQVSHSASATCSTYNTVPFTYSGSSRGRSLSGGEVQQSYVWRSPIFSVDAPARDA